MDTFSDKRIFFWCHALNHSFAMIEIIPQDIFYYQHGNYKQKIIFFKTLHNHQALRTIHNQRIL